ncbi:glycosyltransferase family 4 protein [Arthrobacter sp. NPDC056727]|uniref:glycosyltransferase family 4 protein n=1 Tax=Arthrobacter sp. NPDC056727 TaxID=3345927 RepID=UPI0036700BF1
MGNLKQERPEKVVFFYENAGDGNDAVAVAIRELCSGLVAAGVDAETAFPTSRRRNSASAKVKLLFQVIYLLRAAQVLFRRSRRQRVVITLDVPTGLRSLANLASSTGIFRITHVSWVMDLYRFTDDGDASHAGLITRLQKMLDQVGLAHSPHTVVLGQCMRDFLKSLGGVEPAVIPIWQDPEKFPKILDTDLVALRRRLSLEGKFVVLYSGSARTMHPLQGLVDAARLLRDATDIVFLIVGRGSEIDGVRRHVKDLGLENTRVMDFRPADEVPLFAALADLHVVSLSPDATGTCVPSKAYSAMAAERPLLYLGSDDAQVALDVIESQSGVVVQPNDSAAIAKFVVGLAKNPQTGKLMGAKARAYFLQNRALQNGVLSWRNLIQSL